MKIILLFSFVLLNCYPGLAQDPKAVTIHWTLGQGKDLLTNQSFEYSGSFVTHGDQPIQWNQKSVSSTFSVSSITGTWTDISSPGQLVFAVTQDGASGVINFRRDSSGLYITMEFPMNDPQGSKIQWKISEVTQEN